MAMRTSCGVEATPHGQQSEQGTNIRAPLEARDELRSTLEMLKL